MPDLFHCASGHVIKPILALTALLILLYAIGAMGYLRGDANGTRRFKSLCNAVIQEYVRK